MDNKIQKTGLKTSQTSLATVSSALAAPSLKLSTIRKEQGDSVVYGVLIKEILRVVEFMNVGKTMNNTQIAETARLLYQEYYFWKPEEIRLCFDKGKMGKYGTTYDRLDGQILKEWLDSYDVERTEIITRSAIDNHKLALKEPEQVPITDPRVQKIIDEIKDKIKRVPEKKEWSGRRIFTESWRNARLWYLEHLKQKK